MFTGLIQSKAKIKSVTNLTAGKRMSVAPASQASWNLGESIALNGVCLTLVAADSLLHFDVSPETLSKTTISSWASGKIVNFERALRVGDSLGGHFVQGHVDGVARVQRISTEAGFWRMTVEIPRESFSMMIPKGSITIDGLSLTINNIQTRTSTIELQLIPETLKRTTLSTLEQDSQINFEIDIICKTISHITLQQSVLKEGRISQ
jgi:riboflavin synthase